MSDNIPVEIQVEIMKRLPAKSLSRFRSVSKTWKSLIDSSAFINKHYGSHHTQVQLLLVKYVHILERFSGRLDFKDKYVSVADDHTFPQQKVSLTRPLLVKKLEYPSRIIGTFHGLVGLDSRSSRNGRKADAVVIWNISIRKAVAIVVPNIIEGIYGTTLGFGVCRETNDPKIVKITHVTQRQMIDAESVTCIPHQVEVFTLSTRDWRSSNSNFPRKSIWFDDYKKVGIDGVFYWLASDDSINMDGDFRYMIVSFDMTSEEFGEVTLPDNIAKMSYVLSLSKLRDSLVVVGQDQYAVNLDYDVWMMGDDTPKSFTKLFTFTLEEDYIFTGFRTSGEPIIEIPKQGNYGVHLVVYEPSSKHIDNLGIDGLEETFCVCHYMETLLLLDQPDLMVYNAI